MARKGKRKDREKIEPFPDWTPEPAPIEPRKAPVKEPRKPVPA